MYRFKVLAPICLKARAPGTNCDVMRDWLPGEVFDCARDWSWHPYVEPITAQAPPVQDEQDAPRPANPAAQLSAAQFRTLAFEDWVKARKYAASIGVKARNRDLLIKAYFERFGGV